MTCWTNSESGARRVRSDSVFRELIGQTRDVCEQLQNREVFPSLARELRNELGHWVFQAELASLMQGH